MKKGRKRVNGGKGGNGLMKEKEEEGKWRKGGRGHTEEREEAGKWRKGRRWVNGGRGQGFR